MNIKHATVRAFLFAGLGLGLVVFDACNPGQKQAARTAVDFAQTACIIANAALPDERVKTVCGIVDLTPELLLLLGQHRHAIAAARAEGQAGSARCAGDAGPNASERK